LFWHEDFARAAKVGSRKHNAFTKLFRLVGCGSMWGLVKTDVSEERVASVFRIEEITLARKR
jgi:hypothetical protein